MAKTKVEENTYSLGYGFFLFFLSLAIGFGKKNHQPSTTTPIAMPAMMSQLPSDIPKPTHSVSIL